MPNYKVSLPITDPEIKEITHFVIEINASTKESAIEFTKWLYENISGKKLTEDVKPRLFKAKSQIYAPQSN